MSVTNLSLQGHSCILFQDDVKSKEINRGALLVPYNGDKSIMIDRYDGRGHLSDLQSYEGPFNEQQLSHEEWEIEQSCNYERYYDLYHSYQSDEFQSGSEDLEDIKNCIDQSHYRAVGFNYENITEDNKPVSNGNSHKDNDDSSNDTPYICPFDLKLLPGMVVPATEREAAIIEQTAKFVADKGPQLEILIKAKQANNPKFVFLNYDDKLNPFYRHMTHLIKTAQYVPSRRHISHLVENSEPQSQEESRPLPVVPKIDISSTSYGKLIERLKMSRDQKSHLESNKSSVELVPEQNLSEINDLINGHHSPSPSSPSQTIEQIEATRHKLYEELYQQYYPYYYHYYCETYGATESHDSIVDMARNMAASSAAASSIQSSANGNGQQDDDDSRQSVMRLMAQYVARNGVQFEQMLLERDPIRFAFLVPGHTDHYQYQKWLDKELNQTLPTHRSPSPLPHQTIASIVDSYGSDSPPHSSPISFKMTAIHKNAPVLNIKTNDTNGLRIGSDDLDDDFDFTDKLHSKFDNGSARTTKNGRISRFSPANPKNLLAASQLKNDIQIQRKRKAAEFLASRMISDKIIKSSDSTSTSNGQI